NGFDNELIHLLLFLVRCTLALVAGLEHFQHALGYHITAGGVTRTQQNAEEADHLLQSGAGVQQCPHGTHDHDAVNEVGAGHQRGMQNGRNLADDLVAGEGRQHEDVQGDKAGNGSYWIHDQASAVSRALRAASLRISPAWVRTAPARISSSQSMASSPSLTIRPTRFCRLRAYSSEACSARRLGTFSGATMVAGPTSTVSPGTVSGVLPPPSAARSMITDPGFIPMICASLMIFGLGRPGMAAVVMTASACWMWRVTTFSTWAFSSSVSSRA